MRILVLHGPNLNLLGTREPEVYGATTLAEIDERLRELGAEHGVMVLAYQSNHEGVLIDRLQTEGAESAAIILNPGALTHYSYALRDAVAALKTPVIEVHLSRVESRERFRHRSVIAPVTAGRITGFGPFGYEMAFLAALWLASGE